MHLLRPPPLKQPLLPLRQNRRKKPTNITKKLKPPKPKPLPTLHRLLLPPPNNPYGFTRIKKPGLRRAFCFDTQFLLSPERLTRPAHATGTHRDHRRNPATMPGPVPAITAETTAVLLARPRPASTGATVPTSAHRQARSSNPAPPQHTCPNPDESGARNLRPIQAEIPADHAG